MKLKKRKNETLGLGLAISMPPPPQWAFDTRREKMVNKEWP
jgi:hypothetical protein